LPAGDFLSGVLGVFEKPYYNLDRTCAIACLGTSSTMGPKFRWVDPAAGLTLLGGALLGGALLGGALLSKPRISEEAVASGLAGAQPIGQAGTRIVGSINWRLAGGRSPLSFDAAFGYASAVAGNSSSTLILPAKTRSSRIALSLRLGRRYACACEGR
jgi:hypothetical protein